MEPATIDALGANIEAFIRNIPADMLERVPKLGLANGPSKPEPRPAFA